MDPAVLFKSRLTFNCEIAEKFQPNHLLIRHITTTYSRTENDAL
jgi:hypothetical protein